MAVRDPFLVLLLADRLTCCTPGAGAEEARNEPAERRLDPSASPATLRGAVQAKSLTPSILSISAQGTTAVQADRTANAVTASYVEYVSSPGGFGHPVMARILQPSVDATGTPLSHRLLVSGGLGALLGALIGAICAQAFSRRPRPFRRK